jgi:hypothetical protein
MTDQVADCDVFKGVAAAQITGEVEEEVKQHDAQSLAKMQGVTVMGKGLTVIL